MKTKKVAMAATVALLGSQCMAVARAQDSSSAEQNLPVNGDIIVTAEKRESSLSRVPISVSAFNGEDLKKYNVQDVRDLTKIVPGFTFAQSEQNTPIYSIRGIGFRTPNLSSTSPVGIYVDEVGLSYPYMAQAVDFDIERVEVLKGPQGTLFGRNTTGGLINYIAKKPTRSLEAGIDLHYGNYQSYGGDAYVSGPLSETLSARFAGRVDRRDQGWQKSVTRDERLGKVRRYAGRGSLLWEPTDATTVLATATYWRDTSDTQAPQAVALLEGLPGFGDPRIADSVFTPRSGNLADWPSADARAEFPERGIIPPYKADGEFYSGSLRIDQDLSDATTLTWISAYNHVTRGDVSDWNGTGNVVLSDFQQDGRIGSFSTELRLAGSSGSLDWIAGAYYSRDEIKDNTRYFIQHSSQNDANISAILARVFGPTPYTDAELSTAFTRLQTSLSARTRTYSAFANLEYAFSDQFKLSAGARFTHYSGRARTCSGDLGGFTAPGFNYLFGALTGLPLNVQADECFSLPEDPATGQLTLPPSDGVRNSQKDDNVSGRITLSWTPSPDLLVYGTYSRGYNVGQFPVLSNAIASSFRPVAPEDIDAFEIGIKGKTLGSRLRYNLASYYYKYTNKQSFNKIPTPPFGNTPTIISVPKSTIYGAEAELSFAITQRLSLRGAANYLHTKIDRFTGFDELGFPKDFRGSKLTYAPKWQLSGSVYYSAPVSDSLTADGLLSASYQSSSFSSLDNDSRFGIKAYEIVDATVGIGDEAKGWRAEAFVRNLFDKYYWTAQIYTTDTLVRFAGMPRTYGLSLRYDFR